MAGNVGQVEFGAKKIGGKKIGWEEIYAWEGAASCELRMEMAGATGRCQLTAQ
jgi:hypothetical protein